MKRILLLAFAGVLAASMFGAVSAGATGSHAPLTGTFSDGPFASTSPDSGTCGPNWAWDLFNRSFVAQLPGSGGTFTVTESFKKGHFLTIAGDSPGKCESPPSGFNSVVEGVTGSFGGSFTITVSNGVFNSQGACERDTDGQCTTAGWIHGVFGDSSTYTIPQFSFTYTAKGQGLVAHNWVNADTGNTGDIASS